MAEQQLSARIDAELWLAALREKARGIAFYFGGREAGAARLLLGRGPVIFSELLPPEPPLGKRLAQLGLHYRWISGHFDQRRLEAVHNLFTPRRKKARRFAVSTLFVLLLLSIAVSMPVAFIPLVALSGVLFRVPSLVRPLLTTVLGCAVVAIIALPILALRYGASDTPRPASSAGGFEALTALAREATTNDPARQNDIGIGYWKAGDYRQAASWLEKAAAQDFPLAQRNLALLYEKGQGVDQDYAQAARWLRAAAPNDRDSAAELGRLHEAGLGVPQDDAEARRLYESAAERGSAFAQSSLGRFYVTGHGVPTDLGIGFRWSMAAAKQGEVAAMSYVGSAYLAGWGVAKDAERAVDWLTAAAEAGQADAMHQLGLIYYRQSGPRKGDPEKAYRWLSLVVRSYGDRYPKLPAARDAMMKAAALLTPARIEEIDRESALWKPLPPKPPASAATAPASPAVTAPSGN
jgi:TPR repeat protein